MLEPIFDVQTNNYGKYGKYQLWREKVQCQEQLPPQGWKIFWFNQEFTMPYWDRRKNPRRWTMTSVRRWMPKLLSFWFPFHFTTSIWIIKSGKTSSFSVIFPFSFSFFPLLFFSFNIRWYPAGLNNQPVPPTISDLSFVQ